MRKEECEDCDGECDEWLTCVEWALRLLLTLFRYCLPDYVSYYGIASCIHLSAASKQEASCGESQSSLQPFSHFIHSLTHF